MSEGFARVFRGEKEYILESPKEIFIDPVIVVDRFTPSITSRKTYRGGI